MTQASKESESSPEGQAELEGNIPGIPGDCAPWASVQYLLHPHIFFMQLELNWGKWCMHKVIHCIFANKLNDHQLMTSRINSESYAYMNTLPLFLRRKV